MSPISRVAVVFFLLCSFDLLCLTAQTKTPDTKRNVRTHLARAQRALADKQFETAISELNTVLVLDPKNVEARGNLGVAQFLEGKYAEASQNLQAALRLEPSLWKAQAILGLCEKAQGQFESAQALLEKSFPHLQDLKLQIRAGMALAELDYQHRDLEKTAAVLSVLQKLDPVNVDVLYVLHRVHTDLATQARDSLALVAPDSARMHQLLAQHLVTEGDAKGAVAQYREAIKIEPRLPGAHFELGEAILEDSTSEQSQQDARKEFETALAINPGDVRAECRLGALLSLRGDVDAALSHYRRAAEMAPDDAEAQVGLGKVLLSASQIDKAVEHLQRAVALDPLDSQAHYRLSRAYRQLGRIPEADSELATFKQLRDAKERLRSAYVHIYKESGTPLALNPDIPR